MKEESSLRWIRLVRSKIGKELLSLPNNQERVKYIKNMAAVAKRRVVILKTKKKKAS